VTIDIAAMAKYFLDNAPRCIRAFEVAKADESKNENVTPDSLYSSFDLSCPCGNSVMSILGFRWTNPDSGESLFIGPVSARCNNCSATLEVFDIQNHGYDAELDNGCWSARGEGDPDEYLCSRCRSNEFAVNVFFDFTDDLFGDDFADVRGRECDLFHWVRITGTCAKCDTKHLVCDYECA
jgi:hypothetical protein